MKKPKIEVNKELEFLYELSKYCSYSYTYCSGFESVILEIMIDKDTELENMDQIMALLKKYDLMTYCDFKTEQKSVTIRIEDFSI